MPTFLKVFLGSLLALVVFTILIFFISIGIVSIVAKGSKPEVSSNSVLVIDLAQFYNEQANKGSFDQLFNNEDSDIPGVYDVVRLIRHAATNSDIKGIYLKTGSSLNGFASLEEIRNALIEFKESKKFIVAYGEFIDQETYYVASVSDKIYAHPEGFFDFTGFNAQLVFLKGTLDKLEIKPQIFYAGKFKSATEPFRVEQMTEENRLQTSAWLGDIYAHFLTGISKTRGLDTATIHSYATDLAITRPMDAVDLKLIDSVKYDDQVKADLRRRLGIGENSSIRFVTINDYSEAIDYKKNNGDRIALIYAYGAIVDGEAEPGTIASANYVKLIRRARTDKNIKAIVLRVNSGGGSALASEAILREMKLAKESKPVVVSFGDVAASGGYYISCAADSIFAHPTTITGSIGVFGIVPNMEDFFKNKLGITFDGVKTAPSADMGAFYRPLTAKEEQVIQRSIEDIYSTFKDHVVEGRNKPESHVDSIAQGRVWSGKSALDIGLIDKYGGLQDAIDCAARMAKLKEYRLREYPEVRSLFDRLFAPKEKIIRNNYLRKELGEQNYRIFEEMMRLKQLTNGAQARLPFDFIIN